MKDSFIYLFIFRLERDKGNLHKELMSSKANADKLNVEKAILEKDAKNHHAKLHEAQGLHNGARDNLMLHFIYFITETPHHPKRWGGPVVIWRA